MGAPLPNSPPIPQPAIEIEADEGPVTADDIEQRGHVGAKFYMTSAILNNGWMALVWAGAPAL